MPNTHSLRRRIGGRPLIGIAAAALIAIGGGAGALAVEASRPTVTMAPATPVAIRSLGTDSGDVVTIRGQVAEIFGNHVVLADATGRALVDLGREGEDGTLVAAGQPVTVQGRFEHGALHAAFLVKPDGKVTALGPLHAPHDGPDGHRRGPGDRNAPPPPPPAANASPATPAT